MGNPQWIENTSSVMEMKDIHLTAATDQWRQQHQVSVCSFGLVSVRATLKLNSEAAISQCLSFEVKEPFFVESRVLSLPATCLFLPSPQQDVTPNPLMPHQSNTKVAPPTNVICIPEGPDTYVHVAVKCKAECQLILTDVAYVSEENVPLKARHCFYGYSVGHSVVSDPSDFW